MYLVFMVGGDRVQEDVKVAKGDLPLTGMGLGMSWTANDWTET